MEQFLRNKFLVFYDEAIIVVALPEDKLDRTELDLLSLLKFSCCCLFR